jgi:hypothetical protein
VRHVLRELDPRFAPVAAFEYASVGTLQFIDWQGTIEGESLVLEGRRLFSLSKQLATGRVDVIAGDHDLTRDYFAAVGA